MFTKNMWPIYRKWAILGVLCLAFYVFVYSEQSTTVAAAPCIQWCETTKGECDTNCEDECDENSTDAACYSCLQSCSQTYFQCLSYAVFCENEVSEPGRCTVNFDVHCPRNSSGTPDCTNPNNNHMGYSTTCEAVVGGYQCINCPNNEYCSGTGDLVGCP